MGNDPAYVPGVCNIGPAERARRRLVGHVGAAGTLLLLLGLLLAGADRAWRLTLVAPATASAAGYIQARLRFCAYYGLRGMFNLGPPGSARRVELAAAIARDRRRALGIGLASIGAGVGIALLSLLV